ncbi:phosphate ABC transporter substrate-binding protein [Mycobacterium lentiflavum]|uniref:Phosphate-binding protein n=1 Tax=Mycobacterium lentiflavum TaxID=141349 RepID=A0A0E3WDT3_MYCLN|nr:phosphate ABC transporter substrate-binding protein PstS [Mycobacterium lentiflavum]MEE3064866.1 phosphate ABC transporter substrate-binding protein PstS [Actinomycetota bacterium]ULP41992.1 phosphate ABC transporter substrate-binding protein PstS [Mycobacterium lentiflavum]CQD21444.1 phosphate ABC transporter substrate-binding protein [Mycobacterium lentiflavum]
MKIRFRVLRATVPLMLITAACGSPSPGASSTSAAAIDIATTPPTSNVTLSETGSKDLYPLLDAWVAAYHFKYLNVTINISRAPAAVGISQAAAGAVDIGASGVRLSDADLAAHPGLMNIALAVSAVYVHYNLPGVTEHLKLNGKVLAAMYRGTIKTWNDPQIAALNPQVSLPATRVVPLHRSDPGTSDTFLFTEYLSKQDPEGWGKSEGFGTAIDFPAVPGALGETGAPGMAGMVTGCAENPGCISYLASSYHEQAIQRRLGEAELANASGNYVLPTAESIQAEAAGSASQMPANQVTSLVNGPAPDGYPIVNYEYAIVYAKQKDPAVAQTIRAFLNWVVTEGSTPNFLDAVHIYLRPLADSVQKLSEAQIAKIVG